MSTKKLYIAISDSGDGFQYESINVLESATMADLGIDERWRVLKRENYSQLFEEDELEEEE